MDLWSINVKNTSCRGPFLPRNSIPEKPISKWNSKSMVGGGISSSSGIFRILEIRVSKRKPYGCQSFVLRAVGKKNTSNNGSEDSNSSSSSSSGNGNQSTPEGDNKEGSNASESNESKDNGSQKSNRKPLDWREFRASLIQEQTETIDSDNHKQEQASLGPKPLPQKWAHPISSPENGCLLVATEKLDGVRTFERTVVLLLRSGTRHPQEGPFGIVINRPLHKRIKHMKPTNLDLQTTFAECSLHFGGPLEASMFLLRAGENSLHGFEEVIPSVCFGARNSLEEASALVKKGVLKPHDFRFFVGYAGWQLDQLREEIESDYWYVAACSANLIFGGPQNSSSEGLWEEILQLMGGHYSELSRKPKQDI